MISVESYVGKLFPTHVYLAPPLRVSRLDWLTVLGLRKLE